MGDVVEEAELRELIELGKPVAGDDEQMVVFRMLIRNSVKITQSQRDLLARTKVVEDQTVDCAKTHEAVAALQHSLAPIDTPNKHIDVRVTRLESTNAGIMGILKSNSGAILLALLWGGYNLIQMAVK
jgi:hypothetical protein